MVEISLAILILLIGPAGFYVIANEWFGVSGWIGVGIYLVLLAIMTAFGYFYPEYVHKLKRMIGEDDDYHVEDEHKARALRDQAIRHGVPDEHE